MEDVATSHCMPMQLFAPLSGRRSLKFAGRAVGYDDLADDCSFNVVHAFNHASSHRREALEAHGTVVARVSFLPPCKDANSGQRHCIYRISCARFTWPQVDHDVPHASAPKTRDNSAPLPRSRSMLGSASSAIQCAS